MSEQTKQKILVVDDHAVNRQLLGDLLKADHTVIMAKNGEQALEKALQHVPDLILLDVMMPEMDGYEVLHRLKMDPHTAGIAVIFITALDQPEDESKGLLAGAADYITKPFHSAVVLARTALHLRLARQMRLLESLANIDALTELPNRRQFDLTLETECHRAHRAGLILSLAMVDVDFFKQYNDHYGHVMGDRALQAVAAVLRASVQRPGDMAARYGGEEFVLIMPNTSAERAFRLADSLRQRIAALAIPHDKSPLGGLTVSMGVATGDGEALLEPEVLLNVADQRLYQAKAAGRNRVQGD